MTRGDSIVEPGPGLRLPSCNNFAELQLVHGEANTAPLGIEWRELQFAIGDREILRGVSGRLDPGRVVGVMGGSGHGKTTLMNVLSARQRSSGHDRASHQRITMSGEITMNGKVARKHERRRKIAYVFQDIALIETETARECLTFSAFLRLDPSISVKEREAYVHGMLTCLHLDGCADTPIGSNVRKGLSGGEQKRVSIGVELVCNPRILFLDEPLSGLDAYNAFTVVRSLRLLSESGVPVMMTVHQPSSEIFEMLDDVLLLHEGEICYNGPAGNLAEVFKAVGHTCPSNYNPSDFAMFTMARLPPESIQFLKDACHSREMEERESGYGYGSSSSDCDCESFETEESDEDGADHAKKIRGRTWLGQLGALVRRDVRMSIRQSDAAIAGNVTMLCVSLVYGWFFFRAGVQESSPHNTPNCLESDYSAAACGAHFTIHLSIVSLVAVNIMFMSLSIAMEIVHKERAVLLRERSSGFYGVVPFFISKCFLEVFIMGLGTMVTLLGTYFLVQFRANFFMYLWEIMLMAFASSSIMYALSAAARSREQAQTLSLLPQVLQFAFSGLIVPPDMVPASLQWMKWACPLFYGMSLLSETEFDYVFEAVKECKEQYGDQWATQESCLSWSQRVEILRYRDVTESAIKMNVLMLVGLAIFFRTLAVIILHRTTKFAV